MIYKVNMSTAQVRELAAAGNGFMQLLQYGEDKFPYHYNHSAQFRKLDATEDEGIVTISGLLFVGRIAQRAELKFYPKYSRVLLDV
jgi:hypothetical protein